MRDFWRTHAWPPGERRLHWLVVFDQSPEVGRCYAAHVPVLAAHRRWLDPVDQRWLHLTLQSLCPTTAVWPPECDRLLAEVGQRLARYQPVEVQLGPPRLDGGALTWAVYPEQPLAAVQDAVVAGSRAVLGDDRVAPRRSRWWPHVTLGYGAVDDPADDELASTLVRAGLPRVETVISTVSLVDQEQDLSTREFRWRRLGTVPIGGPTPYAASV